MFTLKDYIQKILEEENTQGDIGTDKLTKNRKKATPGEPMITPEPLKDYLTDPNHNTQELRK